MLKTKMPYCILSTKLIVRVHYPAKSVIVNGVWIAAIEGGANSDRLRPQTVPLYPH